MVNKRKPSAADQGSGLDARSFEKKLTSRLADPRCEIAELAGFFREYEAAMVRSEKSQGICPPLPDRETMEKLKRALGPALERYEKQQFSQGRKMIAADVSIGLRMANELLAAYESFHDEWGDMGSKLAQVGLSSDLFISAYGAQKIATALTQLSDKGLI